MARRRTRLKSVSKTVWINLVITVAVLLVVALIFRTVRADDPTPAAAAQSAKVDRGTVTATVSASGNISSSKTLNVSFQGSGGVVKAIYVKEGDRVKKGQKLAAVDQASARQTLASAEAQLASAQAGYTTTTQGQTPQERNVDQQSIAVAQKSVDSAVIALKAARSSYALTRKQNNSTVARAVTALNAAKRTLRTAEATYRANPTTANKQALSEASATVSADKTALTSARNARATALLQDRQQVTTQTASLATARTQLSSTRASVAVNQAPARAGAVDSAQAQVDSAQVTVDQARTTLDQTVLRAPAAGTVASITGVVGESSSSSSTGSSTSAETSTSSSSSSTARSGFITLSTIDALEVTADVAEADIAAVDVGQSATITLSADNKRLDGVVEAVDTIDTVTNNVVEYGVTVRLAKTDGVKFGQTSQLVITTGNKDGVLRVSSAALTSIGNQTTATVKHANGTTSTVTVQTGLKGDTETEVLGGLSEGDELVVPQQTSGGSNFTFPGAGGFGGGLVGGPR